MPGARRESGELPAPRPTVTTPSPYSDGAFSRCYRGAPPAASAVTEYTAPWEHTEAWHGQWRRAQLTGVPPLPWVLVPSSSGPRIGSSRAWLLIP